MFRFFSLKEEFAKNVAKVVTGSLVSQVIALTSIPVITRIYPPNEFGLFAIFLSVIMILSSISTLKFDVALVHANVNKNIIGLFNISLIVSMLFSALITVLVIIFYNNLNSFIRIDGLLYFVSFAIFLNSSITLFNHLLNKKKMYSGIKANKILNSLLLAFFSIAFGYIEGTSTSLIAAFIVSKFIILLILFIKYRNIIFFTNYKRYIPLARINRNYPLMAMPSGLIDNISQKGMTIFFSTLFDTVTAGYYSIVERVLLSPITMIGGAIGLVYRQNAQNLFVKNNNYKDIFKKTLYSLIIISLPFFLVIWQFGQTIFAYIFGSEWLEAGIYLEILTPMFFMKFISSPLMSGFYVSNKLNINLLLKIIFFCMSILLVYIGYLNEDVHLSLSLLSIFGSIYYTILLIITYKYSL